MIRRLYDWTMGLAAHPHAIGWLAFLTCIESIFFPIPPEAMMIPMVLAAPHRAWLIVAVA
ncbi:MAG: DedA family protein, partial [Alphaproteobacteria bacterium]|nr:DedA family protein [Alphaproteobacteria bacterium]